MLTQFQVVLIVLLVYFTDKLAGSPLPQRWLNLAIVIVLLVLLILGITRY